MFGILRELGDISGGRVRPGLVRRDGVITIGTKVVR